ncbi:MAG: hypothetical protein PHD05_01245 [Sphaerochaetaceae bacterium]|nr:hypothetical protein [Sphaerochaetaceae bacterium]
MSINSNLIGENVDIPHLTIDDIRNFFNSYIKPFAPYQNEKVYEVLINNLVEYYFNQTYLTTPIEMKQLFEQSDIESSQQYDKLLIAIGVPEQIIKNINLNEKLIFLKSLSDFGRYKGTISFFQKVCISYSEKLCIYELFIDRTQDNWVFKSVPIYIPDGIEQNLSDIPYSVIYDSVPSLLVSEEELTSLYNEGSLILPMKSNLLFFDNEIVTEVSLLYDIIVVIFLHTFKDNFIDIYFSSNQTFTCQLKTIYFIWFYLLTEYCDLTWHSISSTNLLKFIYNDIDFPEYIGTIPTTIENVYQIINEYNDIDITYTTNADIDNRRQLFANFYDKIEKAFFVENSSSNSYSAEEMYNTILIDNYSIVTYLKNRIDNSVYTKKKEVNNILTELYSSLLLYSSNVDNEYFKEYSDYFLRYLPQIMVDPKSTTTYTILYNLKPFHVDIYSLCKVGIWINDKFNQIFINDSFKSMIELHQTSAITTSSEHSFEIEENVISECACFDYFEIVE